MPKRLSLVLLLCLAGTFAWAAAPAITSFAPTRGVVGTVVTITGTDLSGATTVAFNGIPVKAFGTNSPTALFALVPEGATSGKITVTNANGTAISVTDFAVLFGLKNNPKDGASMVWVPGGTFTMGSPDGVGEKDEQPAHQVTLSGYWIYQYDVTVAQYRAFCAATNHELPPFPQPKIENPTYRFNSNLSWEGKTGWDDPALQQHPIVNVSWYDAQAYADWAGVSLPSEAQWEFAARGPHGRNYPWGGTATEYDKKNGWDESRCVNRNNSEIIGKSTWPVGSFPAGTSWCGAQDMAGNVFQWCGDQYGSYATVNVINSASPVKGKDRVLRGGSWRGYLFDLGDGIFLSDNGECRSAYRGGGYDPDTRNSYSGFRCALNSPGQRLGGTFAWTVAPTITNITPPIAIVGTVITITGTYLDKVTAVTFNGITAKTITDNTATSLKVTVPEGATSGKLAITTAEGIAMSVEDFIVLFGLKTNEKDGASMVWVPGATFIMGSTEGVGEGNQQPAHQVTLSGYWIYQYDVTVAQYRAFCTATGYALPYWARSDYSWKGKTGWSDPALQQHPIVNVGWNSAKAYADWAGVTLPTEAQWEYAARGPHGNNYPWGGTATKDDNKNGTDDTRCASGINSKDVGKSTWPVGSFPTGVSWCGVQDMAGNVDQWCGDWYDAYSIAAAINPTGPITGRGRVLRGSSWYDRYAQSAYRSTNVPIFQSDSIGFRCTSPAPGP